MSQEASELSDCPNGPDEDGNWPCDPKGYFGVAECQTCGQIGQWVGARVSSVSGKRTDGETERREGCRTCDYGERPCAGDYSCGAS